MRNFAEQLEDDANSSAAQGTRRQQQQPQIAVGGDNLELCTSGEVPTAVSAPAAPAAAAADSADADAAGGGQVQQQQQLPAAAVPKERWKTLLAIAVMFTGMLMTAASISTVHERVPDSPPLPDVALELFANLSWALSACEILLLLNLAMALTVSLLHRHRWVVLRRITFLIGVVFAYRAITMAVTVLPSPNWRNVCEPKANGSLSFVDTAWRITRVAMGAGFTVGRNRYLCGDSIFSGHTASLTLSYLVIRDYTPPSFQPLHWVSLVVSVTSFIFLVLSHGHYTIDLIVGYWLASRLWLMLHAMIDCPAAQRRQGVHLAQVWWHPIFAFLEANVPPGKLPCEMEPPWPRGCFRRAYQRLGNFRFRLRNIIN